VSLVISAYNEERILRLKIENSLALDYPAERIERVVVSDGSTDGTEAIAREYEGQGVRLQAFPSRRGKVSCLNDVIPTLRSELVVMSDANSMYETQSVRCLVRHFSDPRVGCVCGQLRYLNPSRLAAGEGERVYWGYEGLIKRLESARGSLLGATGAIYAYRRRLFRPVDPMMFCDDVIPSRIALDGSLTIYDPDARCTEEAVDEAAEMRRRTRHASFGLRTMLRLGREALADGRPFVLYECVSHRILRWLGPLALAAMLIATPFLGPVWRPAALLAELVFYGAAALGGLARALGLKTGPLYLPYYFLAINLAGLRGLIAFLRRTDRPYWEPRQ